MEIQKIQRKEKKSVMLSFRITPSESKYIRENNISPSLLFREALKELILTNKEKEVKK